MRVFFITQADPLYVDRFWEEFAKHRQTLADAGVEMTGVMAQEPLGKQTKAGLLQRVHGMYGLVGTAKLAQRFLVNRLTSKTLPTYAEQLGIDVVPSTDLEDPEFLALAASQDLIVSVAAPRIFKAPLLAAPSHGCINIHTGPLPKYQGMMPVFWQLRDGNTNIGISIHRMDEGIDTGDILLQEYCDVSGYPTLDEIMQQTKREGARLMVELLCNFEAYAEKAMKNDSSAATYFTFPTRRDTKSFKQLGYRLI